MKKWIVLAALLAAGPAAAQQGYIGAGVGRATVSDYDTSGAYWSQDSDVGLRVFAGIDVAPAVAVEAGYVDLGMIGGNWAGFVSGIYVDYQERMEATAVYAALVGRLPVSNRVDLVGRIGVNRWSADVNVQAVAGSTVVAASGSKSDISGLFGIGVEADIDNNVTVGLQYERFADVGKDLRVTYSDGSYDEVTGEDVGVFTATARFSF